MENLEIERKWLIAEMPADLDQYECLEIEQGYLSRSPTVRIRRENDSYYLTYKSIGNAPGDGFLSHEEYNLPLNEESYCHLREKCDGRLIRKKRYRIPLEDKKIAELDVFDAPFTGLVIVEVEFESGEEAVRFAAPSWFGRDVSDDPSYKNAAMAMAPIGTLIFHKIITTS